MIILSESKGNELVKNIYDGIIRKLSSAKQLVDFDKEMAAGLYTYALEEFGKLLLVKESKSNNNRYNIKLEWFYSRKAHKYKFPKAFDYLQQNNYSQCIALTEGDCIIGDVHWRDAVVGLLAKFETRLSIFYSDFKSSSKIPDVDSQLLQSAISELEKAVNELDGKTIRS